ncbi:hypothetical protein LVW06_26860, partial [Klebsiella pneumoniae]|nr:hypothetical protein [Klebsiella pneumoniae]
VLRVRSSITKSEPTGKPAGPHDLAFDDFRNGERWQILIWRREVLAGCRGAALTKIFWTVRRVSAVLQKHILSRAFCITAITMAAIQNPRSGRSPDTPEPTAGHWANAAE